MRSHFCPCECVRASIPIVARQRLGKNRLIVSRQRLRLLCGPCLVKGKWAISSSQNFMFAF
jgi:hypothetical protein